MKKRMALWVRLLYRTQKICFHLWFCHKLLLWPLENCVGSESKLYKHDNDNSRTFHLPCYCITALPENAITFTTVTQCLQQWSVVSFGSTVTQRIVLEARNHPSFCICSMENNQWACCDLSWRHGIKSVVESHTPAISNFPSFIRRMALRIRERQWRKHFFIRFNHP